MDSIVLEVECEFFELGYIDFRNSRLYFFKLSTEASDDCRADKTRNIAYNMGPEILCFQVVTAEIFHPHFSYNNKLGP